MPLVTRFPTAPNRSVDVGRLLSPGSAGACINSAGGTIKNGVQSPDLADARIRVLEVLNGQVEAIYSSEGLALSTPQKATARVAFLPALSPGGQRIGIRAFAVADVTLAAYGSSTAVVAPQSVIADGMPKTVVLAVTNIRDEAGVLAPDGSVVVASTLTGSHQDRNGVVIDSAGGIITNGLPSPDLGDARMRYFIVTGEQSRCITTRRVCCWPCPTPPSPEFSCFPASRAPLSIAGDESASGPSRSSQ